MDKLRDKQWTMDKLDLCLSMVKEIEKNAQQQGVVGQLLVRRDLLELEVRLLELRTNLSLVKESKPKKVRTVRGKTSAYGDDLKKTIQTLLSKTPEMALPAIMENLPGVSSKTVRRYLDAMSQESLIVKIQRGREVVYKNAL